MSESPKICTNCPPGSQVNSKCHKRDNVSEFDTRATPGPQCPFVLLDERDAEIVRMSENHVRDMAKADELTKQARRTSQMWKDQHLAGNAEIEKLNGEILVLKNQLLKATREATELRELLDEEMTEIQFKAIAALGTTHMPHSATRQTLGRIRDIASKALASLDNPPNNP